MILKQPGHMDVYRSAEKMTVCVCPLCGEKHKMWLFWRGRGIPRKHCEVCKHNRIERHNFPEYDYNPCHIPGR